MNPLKTLIFVPTYNERENAPLLAERIGKIGLSADLLFLDDNSPDGTGQLLDEMASRNPSVHVIHRTGKLGIGSAHTDGIRWALEHGYSQLVTMDCDFTHSPEDIPALLEAAQKVDVVIGSRYLRNDSLSDWNLFRKTLTRVGHFLTLRLLQMPYDATTAFRVYRLDRLPGGIFGLIRSKGYAFFFESLFILCRNSVLIGEVPIRLPARTYGHSKMSLGEVFKSVRMLGTVYRESVFQPELFQLPPQAKGLDASLVDPQDWNSYWDKKRATSSLAYDLIARFYRRFIIRPLLNHFLKKHFKPGAALLHAGCGSGQVDVDVRQHASITGLDISPVALNIYLKTNGKDAQVVHGSIFKMPIADRSFDGIYNLGVMEHFTESEIRSILTEFRRVLRDNGKLALFWPPEYGTSVIFLKAVHFVLNRILKKNVKLHPDEISRVRSRTAVRQILMESGFVLDEYYFGPRDFFTYAVVVARKAGEAELAKVAAPVTLAALT